MKFFKLTLIILFFVFLLTSCGENTAPATPDSPVGPAVGIPGAPSVFKASTTDRNNDNISYQFDWGDGTASAWSDFLTSGDTAYASRLYLQRGVYPVRVHAQDQRDEMSRWSNPLYLIVGFPDTMLTGIGIGNNPFDIEMLPDGSRIYVTNSNDGNVSVISVPGHINLGSIQVGNNPLGLAALPNSQYIYVMVSGENYVLSLPTSGGPADTINVPGPFFGTALPSGEYVYVTSRATGHVYVIRTSDNTVVDSIAVATPFAIEAHPDGLSVYVSSDSAGESYKIRTNDNVIIDTIDYTGTDMDFSPDGQYLYMCSPDSLGSGENVYVLQTSNNALVGALKAGIAPIGLCVHPSGLLLYVSDVMSSTVSVIYTPSGTFVKKDISVYYAPTYIESSLSGEYIYALGSDYVSVIAIRQ